MRVFLLIAATAFGVTSGARLVTPALRSTTTTTTTTTITRAEAVPNVDVAQLLALRGGASPIVNVLSYGLGGITLAAAAVRAAIACASACEPPLICVDPASHRLRACAL